VGPRAGLDIETIGKILSPLPRIQSRSPGRPVRRSDTIQTELPGSFQQAHGFGFRIYTERVSVGVYRRIAV
jgi:hypothetical protein